MTNWKACAPIPAGRGGTRQRRKMLGSAVVVERELRNNDAAS